MQPNNPKFQKRRPQQKISMCFDITRFEQWSAGRKQRSSKETLVSSNLCVWWPYLSLRNSNRSFSFCRLCLRPPAPLPLLHPPPHHPPPLLPVFWYCTYDFSRVQHSYCDARCDQCSWWTVDLSITLISLRRTYPSKFPTHKRFIRTFIYCDTDTQSANFGCNPFRQDTKRHSNNS